MREQTLEALKTAYLELLREPLGSWRAEHQALYIGIRNAIADECGYTSEMVQTYFEVWTHMKKR